MITTFYLLIALLIDFCLFLGIIYLLKRADRQEKLLESTLKVFTSTLDHLIRREKRKIKKEVEHEKVT